MPLYLAATPDHLTRARAVTPRLAHVAYRLGPGSELLAAPLPPALRGGLMVLSDWDCPPVEEPDRLARQIARATPGRRRTLTRLPGRTVWPCWRRFLPCWPPAAGPCMSRSTAPSPGRRYCCAPPCPAERWRAG